MPNSTRLRALWWRLHRWVGLGLAILLAPIAVSGALLVWHDHLDALLHPSRYAVTGVQPVQPSDYLASATGALAGRAQPVAVRYPAEDGWPVIVMGRNAPGAQGGPARILNVYLDPPTARVLDVVDFRSSLFGWLHRFHENLTIPEYSGRAIVGWAGVGMLFLSLTGLWLWWPRNGPFATGLRWRRAPFTATNLHHLLGFWISIPLAVVSLTGVYLGFPHTARQVMSALAPMNPQSQRPGFGSVVRDARLAPEEALSRALALQPGARPVVIFLPMANPGSGEGGRARGSEQQGRAEGAREIGAAWRVQLRGPANDATATFAVDDRSGAASRLPDPLAGDRAAQWIRWVHEGSHSGPLWQCVVFLTGAFPLVFVVTGVIMWWRGRRTRRELAAGRTAGRGELQAAE